MTKATTISRDSVFRRTGTSTPSTRQGIASPETETFQTAVWLGEDEVQWLDDRCQEIRKGGWRSITRSALIRALIRAALTRPIDLAGISGEAELSQRLASQV